MSLKFGYAFWGFLADKKFEEGKEVSTPDGNASYSWSILYEAQRRGWETWLLQRDRDAEYINGKLTKAFSSFSRKKRYNTWKKAKKTITTSDIIITDIDELPDLDVVLIEWRWPIEGRNAYIDIDDPAYQPDLDRQIKLLEHFKNTNTKIIIWDLDHKLTLEDEVKWVPDAIFETSVNPRNFGQKRTRVEPPILVDELLQFKTLPCNRTRKLVYIGSRYERDDVITEWIKPVSDMFPFEVEFWGNWTKEPNITECRDMWPNILYNRRITMVDFYDVYSTAVACPILAKQSYLETGFITPRPWEALLFGTIPVGISTHTGIDDYTLLIARDSLDLCEIVDGLSMMNSEERDKLRHSNVEKINFMDAKYFVNKIEDVANSKK